MNLSNKYLQFVVGYIAFSFSILEGLSFLINNYGISPKLLDYTLLSLVIGFLVCYYTNYIYPYLAKKV